MMFRFRKAGTRIAATGAVVTLVVLALSAMVARTAIHRILLGSLDEELETLSIAIASDLELRGVAELPHEALRAGMESNTLVYRLEHHAAVLFNDRGVIAATGDLARHARLPDLRALARADEKRDEKPFTAAEPFTGQHRLCRFRVAHLGQNAAGTTLVIFRSIETISRTLDLVDVALALFVLAGFAATAVILAFAMRRALHPVEEVTAFAGRLTARDLSQRVEVVAAGEEFHRLADVVNALIERLQLSFDAQRRLVSDVAHELKTPAAVIAAEAQELARGHLSPDEAREAQQTIALAASGLAREVDDLLELARGDAGTAQPAEEFDVDEAVDDAVATSSALARERGIAIVREGRADCRVAGSRAGVARAVANLIVNAVRYSPRGSRVRVATRTLEKACEIGVADSGPGIPAAERARIFERFVRLPTARREHPEGSGLGLAIVDQVVRAHDGNVEVLDSEEGGALFRVRLPASSSSDRRS
jgi:signal transduction histidine kinase